jgi:hypothetical protein
MSSLISPRDRIKQKPCCILGLRKPSENGIFYDITNFEPIFSIADILRDCRKSTKRAILTILHIIKSTRYEHQKHKFMVFRQSLQ